MKTEQQTRPLTHEKTTYVHVNTFDPLAVHDSLVYRPSPFKLQLQTQIEIAATPEQVWKVLTDFENYKKWNPVIPVAKGVGLEGSKVQVEIHWPGLKPNNYRLGITVARPEKELRWVGYYGIKGLMNGCHAFLIEASGTKTKVTHSEVFLGLLVPFFAPWLTNNVLHCCPARGVA